MLLKLSTCIQVKGCVKHNRYDAIIGSVESVEYLEELDKKVEKRLRDNF